MWITPYIKQHKGLMLLAVLLGVLGVGSGVMLLFISGFLISKSALRPENIMLVYVPIVAVRTFSISQATLLYLERLVSHDVILRIVEKMRTRLYRALEKQALFLQSRYQTGDLLGMLSEDINHLQNYYLRTVFPTLLAVIMYGALIGVLGFFDWLFGLMMALVLAVIVFLMPFLSLILTRRKYVALKEGRNELYGRLTDAVFGLADWQASGRTTSFLNDYSTAENKLHHTERNLKRFQRARNLFIQFCIGIAFMMMIVWAGHSAQSGLIEPTLIAAFVLMMLAITDALAPTSEAIEQLSTYDVSLTRVAEAESAVVPVGGKLVPVIAISDTDVSLPAISEENSGTISLENVTYRYPETSVDVLSDVSLNIEKGRKIAILGRSGVGKSTLLKLLTGALEPTTGLVQIEGNEAQTNLLAHSISILNQKSHLFDTTIGNNIRIGQETATDEEVLEVIRQAQVEPLLQTLPNGMRTPMEEMGQRFSGGERQRIAFARVLLQETPIVIFDEPTIGLDPKTERALLDMMFSAAKEKTVIWVTHHLAGIEQMDEIIFLEDGKIALQGSHAQLLSTSKKYRALYEMDKGI